MRLALAWRQSPRQLPPRRDARLPPHPRAHDFRAGLRRAARLSSIRFADSVSTNARCPAGASSQPPARARRPPSSSAQRHRQRARALRTRTRAAPAEEAPAAVGGRGQPDGGAVRELALAVAAAVEARRLAGDAAAAVEGEGQPLARRLEAGGRREVGVERDGARARAAARAAPAGEHRARCRGRRQRDGGAVVEHRDAGRRALDAAGAAGHRPRARPRQGHRQHVLQRRELGRDAARGRHRDGARRRHPAARAAPGHEARAGARRGGEGDVGAVPEARRAGRRAADAVRRAGDRAAARDGDVERARCRLEPRGDRPRRVHRHRARAGAAARAAPAREDHVRPGRGGQGHDLAERERRRAGRAAGRSVRASSSRCPCRRPRA